MAREIQQKVESNHVYRYILEPYRSPSSRITCPNCRAKHSYARYVDVTNGEVLDDKFGKCDRVERCGYFETPYGADIENTSLMVPQKEVKEKYKEQFTGPISLINKAVVLESQTMEDTFSKFLIKKFGHEKAVPSLLKYKVGESTKWDGATVFWQLDEEYDVRTGKIILYDDEGKRVKKPFPKISWEHISDKDLEHIPDFNLKQCLFGQHLVKEETEVCHIVEAEKTAVICDIFSKAEGVWVSIGGLEMISEERLRPLQGKKLIFYPDKGDKAQEKWTKKLEPLMEEWDIRINRSLETSTLEDGSDLADYILTIEN